MWTMQFVASSMHIMTCRSQNMMLTASLPLKQKTCTEELSLVYVQTAEENADIIRFISGIGFIAD